MDERTTRKRYESERCSGPKRGAERGVHRQSIGEDKRTRGIDGYDAGKKIMGRKRHIFAE